MCTCCSACQPTALEYCSRRRRLSVLRILRTTDYYLPPRPSGADSQRCVDPRLVFILLHKYTTTLTSLHASCSSCPAHHHAVSKPNSRASVTHLRTARHPSLYGRRDLHHHSARLKSSSSTAELAAADFSSSLPLSRAHCRVTSPTPTRLRAERASSRLVRAHKYHHGVAQCCCSTTAAGPRPSLHQQPHQWLAAIRSHLA